MAIQVASDIIPRNGGTWTVVEDIHIKGGYRSVPTKQAMLDLPAENLKTGSMVFVESEQRSYLFTVQWDLYSEEPLRIGVIGDSTGQNNTEALQAWPGILQSNLNGYGCNVKVHNFSLGGASFSTAGSTTLDPVVDQNYRFGTKNAVEHVIDKNCQVVIVNLGSNDSGGYIDGSGTIDVVKRNRVLWTIDDVFNKLRAGLPNAKIVFGFNRIHDAVNWSVNFAKNKHLGLSLGWTIRNTGPVVLQNIRSKEIENDDLLQVFKVRITELMSLKQYVVDNHPDVHVYDVDYFMMCRMGGLACDLVHPNGIGHQMLAGFHLKGLTGLPEFPNLPVGIIGVGGQIDGLINSALESDNADGWREKNGQRYNQVNEAFMYPLDPYYWMYPLRPSITFLDTVNMETGVVFHAERLTPDSTVHIAVGDSGSWIDVGTTNSSGGIYIRETIAALGLTVGVNQLRLRVRSPNWELEGTEFGHKLVFGPYNVSFS